MSQITFRSLLIEAVKYWEPRRLLFNAVLLLILLYHVNAQNEWGVFGAREFNVACLVFALAANVLYCLAYPPDMALRYSLLSTRTKKLGTMGIFVLGLIVGSIITDYVADELVRSFNWVS